MKVLALQMVGGRAAEQLVFGEISTGAADDLARVTDIARAMVLRYGMSEALGSGSAVLFDLRLGVCRDVRRSRCRPGARPVRASSQARSGDYL
jgi:hypothetical protein